MNDEDNVTGTDLAKSIGFEVAANTLLDKYTAGLLLAPDPSLISKGIYAIANVGGSAAINYFAQRIRGGKFNLGELLTAGGLSLVPGGVQAKTLSGRVVKGATKGAGLGALQVTGESLINKGKPPELQDLALGTTFGGVLSGGLSASPDGIKFLRALRNRTNRKKQVVQEVQQQFAQQKPQKNLGGYMEDEGINIEDYGFGPEGPRGGATDEQIMQAYRERTGELDLDPNRRLGDKGFGSLPPGEDLSEFLAVKRNRYDIANLMLRKANLDPKSPFYKRLQLAARAVPEFVRRNEDGFLYFDYNLFKDSMRPKQRGRAYIQLFESDLDTILDPSNFAPDAGRGTKLFREFDITEFRETFLPAAELLGLTGKKTVGRMDVTNVHHIAALKGIMGIFDGLGFNSPMVKQIHKVMKEELGGLGAERDNLIRLIGGTADKGSPHQLAHFFLDEALGVRGEKFFTSDVLVNMNASDNFRISKARELARIVADSEKIARQAQDAYRRLADAALATDFKDIQDTLERLVTSKKLGYVKLNNVNYAPIIRETAARGGYNVRQFDELIEDIALIHKAVPTGSPKLIDELLFSPELLKSQKSFQKLVQKIDEKFGDTGVTGAEMRRILDAFDVRLQNAGIGQTGLFEDIPDNLIEDVLNTLQAKKRAKFTKRNQKRYQQDKDIN